MTDNLKGMEWTTEYVNSLLQILEANFSYVPSSTAKGELADISLYDHVKLTAAAACCIYDFLEEKGEKNYRSRLFRDGEAFYREEAFLLCSMDISGIWNSQAECTLDGIFWRTRIFPFRRIHCFPRCVRKRLKNSA